VCTTRFWNNRKIIINFDIKFSAFDAFLDFFVFFLLLDFSDSRFVSDPADGTNCMTSSCAYKGHVNFVKVYCNSIDDSVQGLCGKYGCID
jgi:hypothetical protein